MWARHLRADRSAGSSRPDFRETVRNYGSDSKAGPNILAVNRANRCYHSIAIMSSRGERCKLEIDAEFSDLLEPLILELMF